MLASKIYENDEVFMVVYITKKADVQDLERVILEAAYAGERFLIQRDDGVKVAIVPSEDLELLEEVNPD